MINVFTYGSLMFAPVWRRVVRGEYRHAAATLAGHARFAVAGQIYPGMIAQPGASVQGVLYFDVAAHDLALLDAFEGAEYRRRPVVLMLQDGAPAHAHAYLYQLPQNLSETPWSPNEFRLQQFLAAYCRDSGE